jgi:hypothetical protein
MSEFACKHGHLMSSRDLFCQECAEYGRPYEGVYTMDGMTARQLLMMERNSWAQDDNYDEEEVD